VAEQPAGTLDDVGPDGGRGLGPFGSQPAWQGGQQRRRDREADRVEREWRRRGGCEQEPAEGRPDQGGADDLDGLETGVGPRQAVAVDHHRQRGLGGVVEHGVGGGGREEDHQQDRDRRLAGEHGEGQQPMQAVRARSAATISQRRSARSATAPLGSANSSHGSVKATPTAPILRGSSVSDAASSGAAATVTPSPRLEAAAATSRVRSARDRSMGQFTTRSRKGPGWRPTPPRRARSAPWCSTPSADARSAS
jgi:hypothetical protein